MQPDNPQFERLWTSGVDGPALGEARPGTPIGKGQGVFQQQRRNSKGQTYVIGPTGRPLTLADLPLPNIQRWVTHRKAEVVVAVRGGLLSLDDACSRYSLTLQEFLGWQRAVDLYGLAGLRTTRTKQYRQIGALG